MRQHEEEKRRCGRRTKRCLTYFQPLPSKGPDLKVSSGKRRGKCIHGKVWAGSSRWRRRRDHGTALYIHQRPAFLAVRPHPEGITQISKGTEADKGERQDAQFFTFSWVKWTRVFSTFTSDAFKTSPRKPFVLAPKHYFTRRKTTLWFQIRLVLQSLATQPREN